MKNYDVLIIGAGAAGLMCAIEAGVRGRSVLVIDHASKIAEKIRISGGGRCNFTNIHASPKHYLSHNPHFCVSALKRYTSEDFISKVKKHGIAFHEKTLGQLFCDRSSQDIITLLLTESEDAGVEINIGTAVESVTKELDCFQVKTSKAVYHCASLVIATGGLSIPKIGASGFGYSIARQFGIEVLPTRAGLVPFVLDPHKLQKHHNLTGVAVDVEVSCQGQSFKEAMLFTHRGLSGPAILQISSYWGESLPIEINMAPGCDLWAWLKKQKQENAKQELQTALAFVLPKRLAEFVCSESEIKGRLADISDAKLGQIASAIQRWQLIPTGTEGYRTAEVTIGGINTDALSSKTMEARDIPGLFFIGEVVDVTGHLGGYNFQWAWSSGYAAGQFV